MLSEVCKYFSLCNYSLNLNNNGEPEKLEEIYVCQYSNKLKKFFYTCDEML